MTSEGRVLPADHYGAARCSSCGKEVEGTVEYLLNVHVPACIERERQRRTVTAPARGSS